MSDKVFVGRSDELARFKTLLGTLPIKRRGRFLGRSRGQKPDAGQVEADRSRVVLVHGLGGSGKSRLLRQFQAMADGSLTEPPVSPGQVQTVFLDWEDSRRELPTNYASANGPSLITVLDAIQQAVIETLAVDGRSREQAEQAFTAYRVGAAHMPQYVTRFADLVAQSHQSNSPVTGQDAAVLLKSLAAVGLVGTGHLGGLLGLSPDQIGASVEAAGRLSEAATRVVTGKKHGELPLDEYYLVMDPARELSHRVAAALRTLAKAVPLVIFLDTGEVIGGVAWRWLLRVMTQTGPRVVWIVGARFETEAEAGVDSLVAQFVRDIGDAHLSLMSPTRFDDAMISDYLSSRRAGHSYSEQQIDMIARFTKGLPLAISLTAGLLEQGERVEDVCRETDDGLPSSVVSQLARRYLVHAEQKYLPDDPRHNDLMKILGLALAYGDLRTDPDLLAALWDVPDPLTAFQDLAQRHDFVLPISRRLHDDVRNTLRLDLLDPWRRARVRDLNQRAINLYKARLNEMRNQWSTLDQQLAHDEFKTAILAALWHSLWADERAGLRMFSEILPVLAVTDRSTADAAATIVEKVTGTLDHERPATLISPKGLRIGEPHDREVAVMVWQAQRRTRTGDDGSAIAILKKAATQADGTLLKSVIGSQASSIASRLVFAGPENTAVSTINGLAAAEVASKMLPDDATNWHIYGVALRNFGRLDEALTAYDKAIALDPSDGMIYHSKGVALDSLARFDEALAAHDQAAVLIDDEGSIHNSRALALYRLGRFDEALVASDKALALSPTAYFSINKGCILTALGRLNSALTEFDTADRLAPDSSGEGMVWAGAILWHQRNVNQSRDRFAHARGRISMVTSFYSAELEAIIYCALDQPEEGHRKLVNALPHRIPSDRFEAELLYKLLSDPPMAGIDRLHGISST